MRRRIIEVADTYASAKRTREVFQGQPVRNVTEHGFGWPRFIRYLGRTNSENYFSDKSNGGGKGTWEMFKHIAEGPQYLFVNDEITTLVNDHGEEVRIRDGNRIRRNKRAMVRQVDWRDVPLQPGRRPAKGSDIPSSFSSRSYEIVGVMPRHLADLAPSKGTQWLAPNGKFYEARIPHSTLAACTMPQRRGSRRKKPEVVLVVYSDEGMHFIITGPKLDVTHDGIVG